MAIQKVEVTRRITAGYPKQGRTQFWTFYPDRVNQIPEDVLAAILAQKGAGGKSVLADYLEDGTMTLIDDERANAIVEGKAKLAADMVAKTPAQEIAEGVAEAAPAAVPTPKPRKRS